MVNSVKNTLSQNSNGDNTLDLNGTWKIDGVEVEATADEINTLHNPPSSEEIIFPGEDISTSKRITKIDINSGPPSSNFLGVPDSSLLGVVKYIEVIGAAFQTSIPLTNVEGAPAGTSASFTNVGAKIALIGGVDKWLYVNSFDMTFS
jgi:hypothetical protein